MPSAIYDQDLGKNPANYQELTPLNFLERAADVYPDHVAIIHGALRRTYREFHQRSKKLASALAARGIGRGDDRLPPRGRVLLRPSRLGRLDRVGGTPDPEEAAVERDDAGLRQRRPDIARAPHQDHATTSGLRLLYRQRDISHRPARDTHSTARLHRRRHGDAVAGPVRPGDVAEEPPERLAVALAPRVGLDRHAPLVGPDLDAAVEPLDDRVAGLVVERPHPEDPEDRYLPFEMRGEFALPSQENDEYKGFQRKLQEMELWKQLFGATCVAAFLSLFAAADLDIYWPLLLSYFLVMTLFLCRFKI